MAKTQKKSAEGDPALKFVLQFREQSKHNFGHKIPGQSRETLSMMPMAVEQTAAFFQQALVDIGDAWWKAGAKNPIMSDKLKVSPQTIESLTKFQINKADIMRHIVKGVKSGLIGSVFITKVHGYPKPIPHYVAERIGKARKGKLTYAQKNSWQLCLDLVNDFNYFPDPTGEGLGE